MTIIISTGLGFWLVILPLSIVGIVMGIVTEVLGFNIRVYPFKFIAIMFALSSIISWFLSNKANKESLVAFDDVTRKPILEKNRHTIFWIPVQYYSIGQFIFSIALYLRYL